METETEMTDLDEMLVYFPTQGVKLEPHFQEISEEHNDPLLEIKKEPYLESDLIDIKPHAGAAIHVSGEIEMDYTKMKIKTDGLQYDADIEDGEGMVVENSCNDPHSLVEPRIPQSSNITKFHNNLDAEVSASLLSTNMESSYLSQPCNNVSNKKYIIIPNGIRKFERALVITPQGVEESSASNSKDLLEKKDESTSFCNSCGKNFDFKVDLIMHQKSHESGPNGQKKDCPVCGKIFRENYKLRCHLAVHTGEKFYKCNECPFACIQKRYLRSHLTQHSQQKVGNEVTNTNKFAFPSIKCIDSYLIRNTENTFICVKCAKSFEFSVDLIMHETNHETGSNYQSRNCPVCGRVFREKYKLRCHLAIHTGEKFYKCDECHFTCIQKRYLKEHLIVHSQQKKNNENVTKSFNSNYSNFLDGNMGNSHIIKNAGKTFSCEDCDITFDFNVDLLLHKRTHQTGPNSQKRGCPECGKTFQENFKLRCHLALHTGERFYKCNECSFTCIQKRYLQRHLAQHDRQKGMNGEAISNSKQNQNFICTVCGQNFQFETDLIVHAIHHVDSQNTQEKKNKCPICGVRMDCISDLRRHIATHTCEKIYKCSQCSYSRRRQSDLTTHLMKEHGIALEIKQLGNAKLSLDKWCIEEKIRGQPTSSRNRKKGCSKNGITCYMKIAENLFSCIHCKVKVEFIADFFLHHMELHATVKNNCPDKTIFVAEKTKLGITQSAIENLYNCNQCPYSCKRKTLLKNHMTCHKGSIWDSPQVNAPKVEIIQNPFICSRCNKNFEFEADLLIHLKHHETKSGTRKTEKNMCPICKVTFSGSILRNHIAIAHTNEKLHQCSECSYCHQKKSVVTTHLRKVHGLVR